MMMTAENMQRVIEEWSRRKLAARRSMQREFNYSENAMKSWIAGAEFGMLLASESNVPNNNSSSDASNIKRAI